MEQYRQARSEVVTGKNPNPDFSRHAPFQDFFPGNLAAVYVIKPDNFWDRQKTSVSAGKYKKLDVQMISVDELTKYIDAHQIIRPFGGSLGYDHDEWLELRLVRPDCS